MISTVRRGSGNHQVLPGRRKLRDRPEPGERRPAPRQTRPVRRTCQPGASAGGQDAARPSLPSRCLGTDQVRAIRNWAIANGHQVSARGRVPGPSSRRSTPPTERPSPACDAAPTREGQPSGAGRAGRSAWSRHRLRDPATWQRADAQTPPPGPYQEVDRTDRRTATHPSHPPGAPNRNHGSTRSSSRHRPDPGLWCGSASR